MKIIAVLESGITGGGVFNQALNAIVQMGRICEDRFEFEVFSTHAGNLQDLEKLGITSTLVKLSLFDRLIALLAGKSWWRRVQARIKLVGPFEKKIIAHQGDLVYFLTQSSSMRFLQQTNFITTVFDLCHRDTPEFPEVSNFGEFQAREAHFKNNLAQALIIITESEQLSEMLARRYGVDHERCLAIPMSSATFLQDEYSLKMDLVLNKYHLNSGYFFYPAQFWAHKNHVRILEALVRLKDEGIAYQVVFAGGDKGNRVYVEEFISQNNLSEQVRFLGFVPAEDMRGLYEGSTAVVMPTYFGPTNLPPLEAWSVGKPLIYSAHLKKHSGEAAIHIDADKAEDLAQAMKKCAQGAALVASLVEHGEKRLRYFKQLHDLAEKELVNRLIQFDVRRKCWASNGP